MFNFLKEKLKSWFKTSKTKVFESAQKPKVSDKTEEKAEEIVETEQLQPDRIGVASEEKEEEIKKEKEEKKTKIKPKQAEIPTEIQETEEIKEKVGEKGFFTKLKEKFEFKITEEYFDEIFSSLELILLENNVALEVVEKIKNDLKKELVGISIPKEKVEEEIKKALKISIESLLITEPLDLIEKIRNKQGTFVIVFFGINGSGKTTTIAKIAHLLQKNNISVVLAASDTFRAASIEQLTEHASKLGVKIIKSKYNADPASVAFDAIKHAQASGIKAVLIDTAGRMHTKSSLLKEMKKIIRVAKPDLKLFIGESITGNDATEQAQKFNEAVGIDAIILSKQDIDERGGTSLSVSYITGKPILYLGIGQKYNDLEIFDKNKIIASLGL